MVVQKALPTVAGGTGRCGRRLVIKAIRVGIKRSDGKITCPVLKFHSPRVVVGVALKLLFDIQIEVWKWFTIRDWATGCVRICLASSGIGRGISLGNVVSGKKTFSAIANIVDFDGCLMAQLMFNRERVLLDIGVMPRTEESSCRCQGDWWAERAGGTSDGP